MQLTKYFKRIRWIRNDQDSNLKWAQNLISGIKANIGLISSAGHRLYITFGTQI